LKKQTKEGLAKRKGILMYEDWADFHGEDANKVLLLERVLDYLAAEWVVDLQKIEDETKQKIILTVEKMQDQSVPAIAGRIAMTVIQLKHWAS